MSLNTLRKVFKSFLFSVFQRIMLLVAKSPLLLLQNSNFVRNRYYWAFSKFSPQVISVDGVLFGRPKTISSTGMILGFHEIYMTKLFKDCLRESDIVIDVGAFIGQYTCIAAKKCVRGHVYAFEPTPESYTELRRNIHLNQFYNVTALRKAVSAKSGEFIFYTSKGSEMSSSLHRNDENYHLLSKKLLVECVSLDSYFRSSDINVNVVKIDVEGSELEVLQGMKNIINRSERLTVFIEFAPSRLSACGILADKFYRVLDDYGFYVYAIDEENRQLITISESDQLLNLSKKQGHINLLLTKK